MKNVISIVLDAFCYNNLEKKIGDLEITPFINKLCKESITFTNIYSQAPYTEAAHIALLGGENTLEEGGYLFGNATTRNSVLKSYKKAGYHTILGYSPYVCSKAYLKGATEYKYTRLFSIQPCFDYRFNYFREKKIQCKFCEDYYLTCFKILDEAFETWIKQCNSLIDKDPKSDMIYQFIKDINTIMNVRNELYEQLHLYENDKKNYIDNIFRQWKSHKLIELNKIYNDRKEIQILETLKELYTSKLLNYQKNYERQVLRNNKLSLKYIMNMLWSNKDKKDWLRTIRNYFSFKKNKDIENYLNLINPETKCEVSLQVMIDTFFKDIKKYDEMNENYFLYFQPQEFHLPSLFHSFDINDIQTVKNEFDIAFSLLDRIDNSYKGNIIADLSARFCDYKIECFYNKLKNELKNDFIFVITADHGYPSYYNPPRPIIYNQTYTEAFHIPFIIHNLQSSPEVKTGLFSILDGIELLKQKAGISDSENIQERDFILCEYAGPGCPMINEKKIWYTYIDKKLKLSAEVKLNETAKKEDIINIFDIENNPEQTLNLRTRKRGNSINIILNRITDRSKYLGAKLGVEGYLYNTINLINYNE